MADNVSNHDEKMEDQTKDTDNSTRIRNQMNINDLSNPIEEDKSISKPNSANISPTTKIHHITVDGSNDREEAKNDINKLPPNVSNLVDGSTNQLQPSQLSTRTSSADAVKRLSIGNINSRAYDRTSSLPLPNNISNNTVIDSYPHPPSSKSVLKTTDNNSGINNRLVPHIISPQLQTVPSICDLNRGSISSNLTIHSTQIQPPNQFQQSMALSPPLMTQYQTALPILQPQLVQQPQPQTQTISSIPLPIQPPQQQRGSLVSTPWSSQDNSTSNNANNNVKYNFLPVQATTVKMEYDSPTLANQTSEATTPVMDKDNNSKKGNEGDHNTNEINTHTEGQSYPLNINHDDGHIDFVGDAGRSNSNPDEDDNDTIYLSKKGTRRLRDSKRAVQNRNAQKAFRQRKEKYVRLLENKARKYDELLQENVMLRREINNLKNVIFQLDQRLQMFNDYYVSELQQGQPPPHIQGPVRSQPVPPLSQPQRQSNPQIPLGQQSMRPPQQFPPPPPPPAPPSI